MEELDKAVNDVDIEVLDIMMRKAKWECEYHLNKLTECKMTIDALNKLKLEKEIKNV